MVRLIMRFIALCMAGCSCPHAGCYSYGCDETCWQSRFRKRWG